MTEPTGRLKILLYGLGGIGGFYAFILSRNDNVSLSVVARSNYDAVKQNGLNIESANHGSHVVRPAQVLKHPADAGFIADYIVCCHKAIDPEDAPPRFRDVVGPKTTFVIAQNGVGNEEPFQIAYPKCTILSCVVWVGATQVSPGTIQHYASEHTELGIYSNPSLPRGTERARLDTFTTLLRNGNTPFTVADDIQLKRWEKVVWNAAWNPLTALTLVDTQTWLASSSEAGCATRTLMREVIGVARALGVGLQEGLADVLMARIRGMEEIRSSMYVDAVEGRPLEYEVILGTPWRRARDLGMETPTLDMVYALTVALDGRLRRARGGGE